MAAPVAIPWKPLGANGCQCAGFTYLKLTRTKNPSTTSLMATIQKLKLADSRMPQTRTIVISVTMPTARMLKMMGMPKMCGAAATTCGIFDMAVP